MSGATKYIVEFMVPDRVGDHIVNRKAAEIELQEYLSELRAWGSAFIVGIDRVNADEAHHNMLAREVDPDDYD